MASNDNRLRIELIHLSSKYAALQVFITCWCNERVLSKVTPRFRSDCLKLMVVPQMQIVLGSD